MTTPYGMLTDYKTGEPIRPANREEWNLTVQALDDLRHEGTFRDEEQRVVYVDGGPDPDVTDQAIYDLQGEADSFSDRDQSSICQRALEGDQAARDECTALIRDTRCREAEGN